MKMLVLILHTTSFTTKNGFLYRYYSYFIIDSSTTEITFAQDYDYDDPLLPHEFTLLVRCSSEGGYSDDTNVTIVILDINDNNPVCSPSQTTFHLQYDQADNVTLVNLDCSDIDSTTNAELEYHTSGYSGGYTSTYFDVDTSGNVSLKRQFDMDFNTSFYVTFFVNDKGTPSLSATVTLTVTYTKETKIITYTRVSPCFLCTTSALTIIAALGLVGLMVFICLVVLCVLKCCHCCEMRKIRKALSKAKKRTWRCCGCLRPGKLTKTKRERREIQQKQLEDLEYIAARNAILGLDQPRDFETEFGLSKPQTKDTRNSKSSSRRYKDDEKSLTVSGRNKLSDNRDENNSNHDTLTASQKLQLDKLKDVKYSSRSKPGPSQQAASGMIWSFQGRK